MGSESVGQLATTHAKSGSPTMAEPVESAPDFAPLARLATKSTWAARCGIFPSRIAFRCPFSATKRIRPPAVRIVDLHPPRLASVERRHRPQQSANLIVQIDEADQFHRAMEREDRPAASVWFQIIGEAISDPVDS